MHIKLSLQKVSSEGKEKKKKEKNRKIGFGQQKLALYYDLSWF